MLRASHWTALACFVLLSTGTTSTSAIAESYLGIYAESQGTTPCATISPPAQVTLYLIAKLDTTEVNAIAGAEYRIEISNPSGWSFSYTGPGGLALGDPLDTFPESADTSGLTIAFDPCLVPVGNHVSLGTITATNFGAGGTTELRVRRHSSPTNPTFQCPTFTLCDTPMFSTVCMSPSTEAPCVYAKPTTQSVNDPTIFVFRLNTGLPAGTQAAPALLWEPLSQDIVGTTSWYSSKTTVSILQDTTWVGDWNFDGFPCNPSAWEEVDNRAVEEGIDFGEWGRLYRNVTDNDPCTENTTCAWLWTDDGSVDGQPTLYNDPSMSFGPGGYVIRNWLDNTIFSPWVSLPTSPPAAQTVLSFREFPGNFFERSKIARGYSVRGKDALGAVSRWVPGEWDFLDKFTWLTKVKDLSSLLELPSWQSIQVRLRVADQQIFGQDPPNPGEFMPGPGPFLDRVRIGRVTYDAPAVKAGEGDARWQAQDAFPSSSLLPYAPTFDRFGSCAFSMSADINAGRPTLIRGDSIAVQVVNAGHGAIQPPRFFFAIVAGPHSGKVPPGAIKRSGGLCEWLEVTQVQSTYFVDPPDDYFRGGDVVHYFWWVRDEAAGVTSSPRGITELDIQSFTLAQAEAATGGVYEVSFLPTITWDPAYLARVQADLEGDVVPTQQEIDNSEQSHCILYVNKVNTGRRSGDVNRTSFMFTLDRLGYGGRYDVYDVQGFGNTNNDLGSRARTDQAVYYSLIVHDAGTSSFYPIPDGSNLSSAKVDQAGWYSQWLDIAASASQLDQVTLWVIGENVVETIAENPLIQSRMGVVLRTADEGGGGGPYEPEIQGVSDFQWADGQIQGLFDDRFRLDGGCPNVRDYDGLDPQQSAAVTTHKYRNPSTGSLDDAAIALKATQPGAASPYNTIMMAFSWFDIAPLEQDTAPPDTPAKELAYRILFGALPLDCLQIPPTDVPETGLPRMTRLYQNVPNPFNPRTAIRFDLASETLVDLRIYDVAGRLVRTLVSEALPAKQHEVIWDGRDELGERVASGIYFYELMAGDYRSSRKLVVLK